MELSEKQDLEKRVSLQDEKPSKSHVELACMLADLPDPDAGKSDEERAAIVRQCPLLRV
jgi:hypothetical protein